MTLERSPIKQTLQVIVVVSVLVFQYVCQSSWYLDVEFVVSHVEYAPRALLMLEKNGTDRQTDRRTEESQTVSLRLPVDADSKIITLHTRHRQCCTENMCLPLPAVWQRDACLPSERTPPPPPTWPWRHATQPPAVCAARPSSWSCLAPI